MPFDPKHYKRFRVSNWGHSDPVYKEVAKQLQVQGGVCRGMCLDWSRRILHGKGAPHEKDQMPVDKDKARKRYIKQIDMHKAMIAQASVPGYFENTLPPLLEQQTLLLQQKARCIADAKQVQDTAQDMTQRFQTGQSVSALEQQANANLLKQVIVQMDHVNKTLPVVQDQLRDIDDEISDIETYLKRKFPEMYANFQVAWKNHKTKNFQSINASAPRTNKTTKVYTRGEDVWTQMVLPFLTELEAGDCALFQAGEGASNTTGHALAFHLSHSGNHCFFDPNFGEFRFDPTQHADMKVFFLDLWDWTYAKFTWIALVRLRHANGSTFVAPYDPISRKVKGTSCTVM